MAKQKNDYFQLTQQQAENCVHAAQLLETIVCNYAVDQLNNYREQMHNIEQRADEVHHDILTKLFAEFITPIDQEDILRLVQIIDDITDALDEVVLDLYMYHIETMPADAPALCQLVCRCVTALLAAVKELKNFKKPETLRELLVAVHTIESEGDDAYVQAIHDLFAAQTNAKALVGGKAIYESLENCCDLCEHAANIIEQIIIKNT